MASIVLVLTAAGLLGPSCGGNAPTPEIKPKDGKADDPKVDDPKVDAKAIELARAEPVVEAAACQDVPTSINIAPCLPSDVAGGASGATLEQAAIFAWQEFIALNWPAVAQTGAPNTRGVTNGNARLETVNGPTGALPTWMTFRHKIEVFPGAGNPPEGVDKGSYDDPPRYIYDPAAPTGNAPGVGSSPGLIPGQIPPCADGDPQGIGSPENQTFLNADEATEIGQDSMFAGIVEQSELGPNGSDPASASQILFMVKLNRTYSDYIGSPEHSGQWWKGRPDEVGTATVAYLDANKADPPPGSAELVSFPNGTILTKSAWRRSIPSELDDGRHVVRPVRRYENSGESFCYAFDYYTLVALHIIQKTPSAPHLIYATFEHADNILTDRGQPIEDAEGNVIVPGQAPLTPDITSVNATATTGEKLSPLTADCTPGSSLYYKNTPGHDGVPQGTVCVRGRKHPIPQTIIDVNRTAHEALDAYAAPAPAQQCAGGGQFCASNHDCCSGRCNLKGFTANTCTGGAAPPPPAPHPTSALRYYKLVNVQVRPIDKPAGVDYQGPDPATYYLANIVLETNYVLQVFSGTFANDGGVADGTITDFVMGEPYHNTLANGSQYDMGGCMGCHGVAQGEGGGFSFAFDGIAKGFSNRPEAPGGPNSLSLASQAFDARWLRKAK
ncbi:hypothetical protein [Paraliomyxa miuraensis]|uniref:hypothetical protein n=1 Tax=Paraliomyxa miuraensis TaxID=376150 RepID=UPI002252D860|nr:hypothetical protein [Paraliomyxa miuraensis]MCX4239702.1 hypothetical protein [Paraliomyxa miuraensis]